MDIEMTLICCATCGIPFAISKDLDTRLRKRHNSFYCPAGHSQSYRAKSEAEREREKRQKAEREAQILKQQLEEALAVKKPRKKKQEA